MSSVRSVLTDTLREHQWRGDILGCGCGWNWPGVRTGSCAEDERITKAHAEHVADAIAGLSGVAVTQLPEPCEEVAASEFENGSKWFGGAGDVVVFDDGEIHLFGTVWPASDADGLAAALLAASRVAGQHQDPA